MRHRCEKIESIPQILASRNEENWRGLKNKTSKSKPSQRIKNSKQSLYLDKNIKTFEALSHENLTNIPIIRNGNNMELMPIVINCIVYPYTNTCAFNVPTQIMVVAAKDYLSIETLFNHLRHTNPALDFVMTVKKNGTAHCYRKRASILNNLITTVAKEKFKNIGENQVLMDCSLNVFIMASKLFADVSESTILETCSGRCVNRVRRQKEFVLPNALLNKSCSEDTMFRMLMENTTCNFCSEIVEKKFEPSSSLICMEMENDEEKVNIDEIPMSFPDLTGNKEDKYLFIGVVKYTNQNLETKWEERKENKNLKKENRKKIVAMGIGHYTAVTKRHNTWFEYNDARGTQHCLKSVGDKTFFVGLVIYAKVPRKVPRNK